MSISNGVQVIMTYARFAVAYVLAFLNMRRWASAAFVSLIGDYPHIVIFRREFGLFLLRWGESAKAASAFFECLRRTPRRPLHYFLLAHALIDMGSADHAVAVMRQLPGDARDSPDSHRQVARLRRALVAATNKSKHVRLSALDRFLEFITTIRSIILRDLLLTSKTNFFYSMSAPLRVVANSLGHAYLYLLIFRPVPAGMSFLTFCLPVFIIWQAFDHALHYADPHIHRWRSQDKISHTRWLHSFVAITAWDFMSTACVCGLILFVYFIVGERTISAPLHFDSLPIFVAMYFIAVGMGLGLGGILCYLKKLVPVLDIIGKIFVFTLYLTSGVYESYAAEPLSMRELFKYNPLVAVMEYSRKSFYIDYYTADLSLRYSIITLWVLLVFGLLFITKLVREVEA